MTDNIGTENTPIPIYALHQEYKIKNLVEEFGDVYGQILTGVVSSLSDLEKLLIDPYNKALIGVEVKPTLHDLRRIMGGYGVLNLLNIDCETMDNYLTEIKATNPQLLNILEGTMLSPLVELYSLRLEIEKSLIYKLLKYKEEDKEINEETGRELMKEYFATLRDKMKKVFPEILIRAFNTRTAYILAALNVSS